MYGVKLKEPEVTSAVTYRGCCWKLYSVVGMVTAGRKTGGASENGRVRVFLFSKTSGRVLEPNRPAIQRMYGSFFLRCKGGQGVNLITHLPLFLRLRIFGNISKLRLGAFKASTSIILTFPLTCK